ncbi:hypothetical protein [Catellatospora sichuanensis]|uniref:hypothetical protein n=1 Tax=Catellatospora sichuanensis TaxID=1969805 RepID=UPI001183D821|nr:hypothetical protein [Catellatospora sichuanensis]
MTNEVERATAALRNTALDGLPVEEESGNCLIVSGVEPADVLSAWRAARAVLPMTGRWPVFRSSDHNGLDHQREPTSDDLAELDAAARTIDPWSAGYDPCDDEDEPLTVDELSLFVPTFEGVDLQSEARRRFDAPTMSSVDRWIYDRVLADPPLLAQALAYVGQRANVQWRQPSTVELWLLPTPHAHLAAGWVSYHGTLGRPDVLAAALWQWHQAWGAELVASWGLTIDLTTGRRPAVGEQAWELAGQQKSLANHLEDEQWMVALALTQRNEWSLYDRP